ncbi:Transmembrane exosortase [Novipirellula aureliae]|uniref:Transmembrane exosortase n=1 Tax=Novipirellula aureliae TaxID=2527966 RepID=A0A5C6EAX4_9BACT|nr:exosortase/archaeosortase family protein [Novipirellula aureliae]TWU44319.1 Transmembrane exosortase [Novipirellula aureliae]
MKKRRRKSRQPRKSAPDRSSKPQSRASAEQSFPTSLGRTSKSENDLAETLTYPDRSEWTSRYLPALGLLLLFMLYAYWPTLVWMEDSWRNEPDYSHGYLVLPLALFLLWHRRETMPGIRRSGSFMGIVLILVAIAMRMVSRLVYADFLDGWSILVLVAGATWFLFGWRFLRWAAPAIAFLIFMVPLPFQAESMLSWKLQGVATECSTVMLRVLGQPAVSEAHVVWVNDERLLIEEACSGLRIFVGVAALAFFWASMASRNWMDRIIILLATLPLAVFVNALRITFIGLFYSVAEDAAIRHRIHDISGYVMIPVAFVLLWLLKTYWEHLYRPVERMTAKDFLPTKSPRTDDPTVNTAAT